MSYTNISGIVMVRVLTIQATFIVMTAEAGTWECEVVMMQLAQAKKRLSN